MSLDQKIADQYEQRGARDGLYSGGYSRRAFEERSRKIRELLQKYRKEGDTILEVGAGHGDNVPILLDCGFRRDDIFLNEMLPMRISNIRQRYHGITLYEGNALNMAPGRRFNFVFQSTVFTSILSNDDRHRLASKMWEMLEPGGFILWYDFIFNNPSNADVRGVTVSETASLFPQALKMEWQRITLAPPIGRRVGKLYRLFNVPFLRSHILAAIHKPL